MAFVKLRNLEGKEIKVPSGAIKSYRNLGFYPEEEFVENATPTDDGDGNTPDDNLDPDDENKDGSNDGKSEDEIFVETISKKPLANWNKDEVKRYAAIFNIDLTGTKSANEAKERIKAFMSDAE